MVTNAMNTSTSSDGGTAVAPRSIASLQQSMFETDTECTESIQHPVHRFPIAVMQDAVPQLPIRKESSSVHSLFDLDPQDSLPQAPRRQPSDRLMAAARRRTQLRENSSSGSPMPPPGPPTSVIVPQDSLWSAGISTLMSRDDDDDSSSTMMAHRVRDESDPSLLQGEMSDAMPWDQIAIGVVMGRGDSRGSDQVYREQSASAAAGTVSPPPPPMKEFDREKSEGTMSFPSFYRGSSSEPSSGNKSPVPITAPPPNNYQYGLKDPPTPPPHCQTVPRGTPQRYPPTMALCRSPGTRSPNGRRVPAHAALLKPSRPSSSQQQPQGPVSYSPFSRLPNSPTKSQDVPPRFPPSRSQTPVPAPGRERQASYGSPALQSSACEPHHAAPPRHPRMPPNNDYVPPLGYTQRPPACRPTRQQVPTGATMIEVAPGVKLPLRGSDETWRAIEDGRATITMCMCCQIELNCLENAQLVACPDCTMLSPVDQSNQYDDGVARHGVGVGVKPADVIRWIQRHS